MSDVTVSVDGPYLAIREQDGDMPPHRRLLPPGRVVGGVWKPTALSAERKAVRDAAEEAWTAEVVEAYRTEAEQLAKEAEAAAAPEPEPGTVSAAQLAKVLKLLNPKLTQKQIDDAIAQAAEG